MKFKMGIAIGTVLILAGTGCRSSEGWSDIFRRKGQSYAKKGAYEKALAEFQKAKQMDDGNIRVYFEAARVHHALGQYRLAIENINRARQMGAALPGEIYELYGDSLLADGQLQDAAYQAYQRAIESDPSNPLYYEKQARAFQQMGLDDLAAKNLLKAKEIRDGRPA